MPWSWGDAQACPTEAGVGCGVLSTDFGGLRHSPPAPGRLRSFIVQGAESSVLLWAETTVGSPFVP